MFAHEIHSFSVENGSLSEPFRHIKRYMISISSQIREKMDEDAPRMLYSCAKEGETMRILLVEDPETFDFW